MPSPPDPDQALVERDFRVDALRSHLLRGEEGLNDFPAALLRVIEDDAWRDRVDWRSKERFTFDLFAEFVVADAPAGLGADLDLIVRLVRGTPTEAAVDRAIQPGHGYRTDLTDFGRKGNRLKFSPNHHRANWRGRLQRERPDLLERVDAGEVSLHAAAVEAGVVSRKITVNGTSSTTAIRTLLRHFTADELRRALDDLAP